MARLGFTGDVMLGRFVDRDQRTRPPEAVWGAVRPLLRGLDGLVVNLECCLSTRGREWGLTYHPFHFRADPAWAIPALLDVGVDVATLANNHVLDYGEDAFFDTLDALDAASIARTGAGRTVDEAWTPAVVDCGGLTVAVVAATDNTPEFAASDDADGTAYCVIDAENEVTTVRFERAFEEVRASSPDIDLLVVALHWGPNMATEPPERFQRFAHWLAESGVDCVVGTSAHVFQGIELRDGSVILYDCGDFVDDYAVDAVLRNDRSFLVELVVDDGPVEVRLHPTQIRRSAVSHVDPAEADWWHERMRRLSEPFGTVFETDEDTLVLPIVANSSARGVRRRG